MMLAPRLKISNIGSVRSLLLAVVVAAVSSAAVAQDRLAPSFPANPSAWSSDQRAQAQAFVQTRIGQLMAGQEPSISAGKTALVEALTFPGGTDLYLLQLSETIAANIGPVVSSEDLMVRLNGMIVCTYLQHPDAVQPIEQGLGDGNAGVRYHAAIAAANLLAGDRLANNERNDVLNLLVETTAAESDPFVVQPMLDALAQTQDNALVLNVLDRRVEVHAAEPSLVYSAEANALQRVFTRIVTAPNPPTPVVRELAKVSSRYLQLAASQLVEGGVPADRNRSHQNVVNIADTALRAAHDTLAAPGRPPQRPDRQIANGNWPGVAGIAAEWNELLVQPPFGFNRQDLGVTP